MKLLSVFAAVFVLAGCLAAPPRTGAIAYGDSLATVHSRFGVDVPGVTVLDRDGVSYRFESVLLSPIGNSYAFVYKGDKLYSVIRAVDFLPQPATFCTQAGREAIFKNAEDKRVPDLAKFDFSDPANYAGKGPGPGAKAMMYVGMPATFIVVAVYAPWLYVIPVVVMTPGFVTGTAAKSYGHHAEFGADRQHVLSIVGEPAESRKQDECESDAYGGQSSWVSFTYLDGKLIQVDYGGGGD